MPLFGKKNEPKKEEKPNPSFSVSHSSMPVQQRGEGLTVEDIRLIIEEWLKEIHVRFKTRYTKRQVKGVTKMQSVADRYKVKCLQNLLNEFRIAKLSEGGESSKELVSILRERLTGFMDKKTTVAQTDIWGKLFE